jgi:hypothetical protein
MNFSPFVDSRGDDMSYRGQAKVRFGRYAVTVGDVETLICFDCGKHWPANAPADGGQVAAPGVRGQSSRAALARHGGDQI